MTKAELISIINKFDDDAEVYVHIAYNTYDIRQIVNWEDFAVLHAGSVVNPEPFNLDEML